MSDSQISGSHLRDLDLVGAGSGAGLQHGRESGDRGPIGVGEAWCERHSPRSRAKLKIRTASDEQIASGGGIVPEAHGRLGPEGALRRRRREGHHRGQGEEGEEELH